MVRRIATVLALSSLLLVPAWANADAEERTTPRKWRVLADSMLAARGNEGGLAPIGYRLVLVAGVLTPAIDVFLSLDRQMGDDRRVVDAEGDVARYSEWMGSARVGRRYELTKNLWLSGSGGVALVHERVSESTGSRATARFDPAFDVVCSLVWRSGPVVTNVFVGFTAPLSDEELAIEDARFALERHVEPVGGLGVGLLF